MNVIKYSDIIEEIEAFFNAHQQIKTFVDKQINNYQAKTDNLYAMAVLCPTTAMLQENETVLSFNLFCIDRLLPDNSNLRSVLTTMLEVLKDFKAFFIAHDTWIMGDNAVATELEETFDDNVGGWVLAFDIIIPEDYCLDYAPIKED